MVSVVEGEGFGPGGTGTGVGGVGVGTGGGITDPESTKVTWWESSIEF